MYRQGSKQTVKRFGFTLQNWFNSMSDSEIKTAQWVKSESREESIRISSTVSTDTDMKTVKAKHLSNLITTGSIQD